MIESFFENNYIRSILIVILFFVFAKITIYISETIFLRCAKRSRKQVDDLIILKTKSPMVKLLVLIGARIAVGMIGLQGWPLSLINSIIAAITMYLAAVTGGIAIEAWTDSIDKKNRSDLVHSLLPIFRSIANVLAFLAAVIWILREWNIDVTPFLASLGIAGVIVGFAMQDSLKNIFGGISLILDGTFKVGEKVQLETGEIGIIEDVSVRSTKMRTFNNEMLTIPNGKLAEMRVTNYAKPNASVRMFIDFGVAYGTDIKKVRKVVEKIIKSDKDVMEDQEGSLKVVELGDSSVNCQMRFWINDYNVAFGKKLELIEILYNELNKAKIEIPFPTRTVYLKK
jgi:MscS family membrane protein